MTTITKYVCDLCGEVFDDEEECAKHEILEKIGKYSNDIVFFGQKKKVIPFDDVISDYYGVISPWSSFGGCNRKTTGLYLYDEEHYRWYLPADKIEELKKEMKEYGVDA